MLLVCVKAHDFSSKCANDKKCSLYWYAVKQALSNWSENIIRFISVSVFQSIMKAAATSETAYNNSLKSFT